MGENAFLAFGLVRLGIGWQERLGAVFLAGIAFALLVIFRVGPWLARSISPSMKHSFGVGIGLFLLLLGLHQAGLVVSAARGMPAEALVDPATGLLGAPPVPLKIGGSTRRATSSRSSSGTFIESATGIREGARTGLAAVTTAVLFLSTLFLVPLLEPWQQLEYAYAPALISVGIAMLPTVRGIEFDRPHRVRTGGRHPRDDGLHVQHRKRSHRRPRPVPLSEARRGPRPKPFFLFLHLFDVHTPYGAKPSFEKGLVGPYEGDARGGEALPKQHRLGKRQLTETDAAHLSDLYDAGIRQVDHDLGQLFAALEERGLLEETLVVITSDHGEELLEHGDFLHGRTLYEEVVRIPLIVVGPDVPPGRLVGYME